MPPVSQAPHTPRAAQTARLPPLAGTRPEALQYWDAAVQASPAEREVMWRDAQFDGTLWRIALLQSLPQSAHYDPGAARRRLANALSAAPEPDVAAVLRLRLAALDEDRSCRVQVDQLQDRLAEVIEIEKRFDGRAR